MPAVKGKMKLSATNCIKILNRNFGYRIGKDVDFGSVIILPAIDAFFYSLIEKSPYFDKDDKPFTPFGQLNRVFNFVGEYELMSGVFNSLHSDDGPKIINSPAVYLERISNLFDGEKKIVFVELEDATKEPHVLRDICKRIKNRGENPSNYLVTLIFKEYSGYKMEHFCEFVICAHLRKKGFIAFSQLNMKFDRGKPDICAFVSKSMLGELQLSAGSFLEEFSLLRLKRQKQIAQMKHAPPKEDTIIVGDAKTAAKTAAAQLKKYLSTGYFSTAFEVIPEKGISEPGFGLFHFTDDGQLSYDHHVLEDSSKKDKQEEFFAWIKNVIKVYLLINLTEEELKAFHAAETHAEWTTDNLVSFIKAISIPKILSRIESVS